MHAEEDRSKRALVEAKNHADSLIYSTEKSIKDLGDKVDGNTKEQINGVIERLRKAMEGSDAEEIKKITEELTQASHKLAEAMYAKASQEQAGGGPGTDTGAGGPSKEEDVVDADFEEVKK